MGSYRLSEEESTKLPALDTPCLRLNTGDKGTREVGMRRDSDRRWRGLAWQLRPDGCESLALLGRGPRFRRQTCRRNVTLLLTSAEDAPTLAVMSTADIPVTGSRAEADAGFRFGDKGTHSSRTIMLSELKQLFAAVPAGASKDDYVAAIIEENVLGKQTASNRRLTAQRLGELYGLDLTIPLFRIVRRLWDTDASGRAVLSLLCALARDPLLRATARAVVPMRPGEELLRASMTDAIVRATNGRMNPSVTDKVARNAASSWAQAGYLEGRVRKMRRQVRPTPGVVAFAFWLGRVQGLAGEELLKSAWAGVLDAGPSDLLELALRAKQLGLIHVLVGGGVIEINPAGLDPAERS